MRLVVQRVLESSVKVDGREVGRIGKGFMVLCGVEDGDTAEDVRYCVDKTVNLRIFEDENDKMNRSILDAGGEILAISQFTLQGRKWPYRCTMHIVRGCERRGFMWKPAFSRQI